LYAASRGGAEASTRQGKRVPSARNFVPGNRRFAIKFLVVIVLVLITSLRAEAQNRGTYPLGMSAVNSGVTPGSGFTYSNQLLYYARNISKDNDGNVLPVAGDNAVLMDLNSIVWVSDWKVLGAVYSASATLPVATNSLTSDAYGTISGGTGLADAYLVPLILGWNGERVSVRAMAGILAPTGRFEATANDNVGNGYWSPTLSSGQTVQLLEGKTLTFSMFEMYEFHTRQEGTGIHPGQNIDLDYSLLFALPSAEGFRVQMGLAGYEQRQTTAKTGPSLSAAAAASRYAVNALGFAVSGTAPQHKLNLGLKYFKEFSNRSTYQGYSVQLMVGITF
jgi:hypothetical protein